MPLAVLVIDGDAAVEQGRECGGIERLGNRDREQRFGLIEQEPAVAIRRGDERFARFGGEGQRAAGQGFGAFQQLFRAPPLSSRRRISTCARERRAALSSKLGFSVVAPTSVIVPSST
jgi:hypothetical protein